MIRIAVAVCLGLVGFVAYTVAAISLVDILPAQWALQFLYFVIAGSLWVIPARWLMLWAAHRR
jgi:hypothetical protein